MSDLTPPPSKSSTPLRPSDLPEPQVDLLSPASTGSGSSDFEPNIDPTDELATTEITRDLEVISTDDESEEDEGMVLSDDEPVQATERVEGGEGLVVVPDAMGEGEGSKVVGGGKRKTRSTRKPRDKGKGKAVATPGRRGPGAGGGGGGGGKGRKEGELLESDIVSRWNHDFGDVCRQQPTKA